MHRIRVKENRFFSRVNRVPRDLPRKWLRPQAELFADLCFKHLPRGTAREIDLAEFNHSMAYMASILIRFVLPLRPFVTPPVITSSSPFCRWNASSAVFLAP